MTEPRAKGSCLCGGVSYSVRREVTGITACHCRQCAKTTGHFYVSVNCAAADFTLDREETLRWYRSSSEAERGFCSSCGSSLFWRRVGGDKVSMAAGTLEPPTGLRITKHIFCASKSDYYDIDDGVPRYEEWGH